MRKSCFFFLACVLLIWTASCGSLTGVPVDKNPRESFLDGGDSGWDNGLEECAVNTNDMMVKLLWARSEVVRREENTAYCSLFGDLRTAILTNVPQSAAVYYAVDGTNWTKQVLTNRKLSDDKKYYVYYFYTPMIAVDSVSKPRPVIQFKAEFVSNGTVFYSDKGRVFKTCPSPDPTLPAGVIGQAVLGNKHFLTECAEVTSVFAADGTPSGYRLHGHFQVKNDCSTNKTIRIIFRTNTMDWVRSAEPTYPCIYAWKTAGTFYPNGYSRGVENWEFALDLPLTVSNIQFIALCGCQSTTGDWHDRNKCRKYKVNPVPGVMSIYSNK